MSSLDRLGIMHISILIKLHPVLVWGSWRFELANSLAFGQCNLLLLMCTNDGSISFQGKIPPNRSGASHNDACY